MKAILVFLASSLAVGFAPALPQAAKTEAVIQYTDQNNNRYLIWPDRMAYQAVTAARSSSGSYTGGQDATIALEPAAFEQLQRLSMGLLDDQAKHADRREMMTVVLSIRQGQKTEQAILYPSPKRDEWEAALQALLNATSAQRGEPRPVEISPGSTTRYTARLEEGRAINDLSWAWNSSNACFPATQKVQFDGKHLLFTGIIPAYTELTVTLIPDDPKADFSLYGYLTGEQNQAVVPDLIRCIRCEADYRRDRPIAGRPNRGNTRTLQEMLAIQRPYRLTIGVAGAKGLGEGGFTLEIAAKGRN